MDTEELQAAIHQAVEDGDTELAKELNKTLLRIARSTKVVESPQATPRYYSEPKSRSISITTLICFVVLPYWAVAEVAAPGHQGLKKVTEVHWLWGPKLVISPLKGVMPKTVNIPAPPKVEQAIPEPTTPEVTPEPATEKTFVVRTKEPVFVSCSFGDASYTLNGDEYTLHSIDGCVPGEVGPGVGIAFLTPQSQMEVKKASGSTDVYNYEQLKKSFEK